MKKRISSSRLLRRHLVLLGPLVLFLSASDLAGAQAESPEALEYRVKAAFLLNFTRFVEWPAAEAGSPGPFRICIFGDDPFGTSLDRIVEGESLGGHPILVERSRSSARHDCRMAFVSRSENDVSHLLATLGRGVLTVGEDPKFLQSGGMIAFVIDNRRVRFDINERAVREAGLKLSSRLMTIARNVLH